MTDEEILAIAEKYGTPTTRHKPTYHLHDGSPTGETYPQTDWDFGQEDLLAFAQEVRAAVERAEKQEAVGFKDWWKEHSIEWGWTLTEIDAERFWTAAQMAERERCREWVITMGGPDVPELLRQIDSGED